MFQLIAHVKPNKKSEFFGKVLGAYVTIFINYPEIVGAYLFARHYIENGNWKILEIKEQYYVINSVEEMAEDYKQYYDEIIEFGHSLIFNTYSTLID